MSFIDRIKDAWNEVKLLEEGRDAATQLGHLSTQKGVNVVSVFNLLRLDPKTVTLNQVGEKVNSYVRLFHEEARRNPHPEVREFYMKHSVILMQNLSPFYQAIMDHIAKEEAKVRRIHTIN